MNILSKKELLRSLIGKDVTIGVYEEGNIEIGTTISSTFNYKITQVGEDVFEAINRLKRKDYFSISHIVSHIVSIKY